MECKGREDVRMEAFDVGLDAFSWVVPVVIIFVKSGRFLFAFRYISHSVGSLSGTAALMAAPALPNTFPPAAVITRAPFVLFVSPVRRC